MLSKQNHFNVNLQNAEGEWTETPDDGCILNDRGTKAPKKVHISSNERQLIEQTITPEKVKWAINSFGLYKSPGIDGIYPRMLQKSWDALGNTYTQIFRACLENSYITTSLQCIKVVFIPKAGKIQHSKAVVRLTVLYKSFLIPSKDS